MKVLWVERLTDEATWWRHVQQRRARSGIWKVIHALASLRLALALLVVLAVACAVATLVEDRMDGAVARALIYRSPWFRGWLILLCVNLFCVTLTRWPWRARHIGFVLTHYGIILLLAGAWIGSEMGFEGFVTLRKNGAGVDRVWLKERVLRIAAPSGTLYETAFPVDVWRPSHARPKVVPLPEGREKLTLDDYLEAAILQPRLLPSNDPKGAPGMELRLQSQMAGQLSLLLYQGDPKFQSQSLGGIAEIVWGNPEEEVGKKVLHESWMVFASEAPVTYPHDRFYSGCRVRLKIEANGDNPEVEVESATGVRSSWPVSLLREKPQLFPAGRVLVELLGYWPRFAMEKGRPQNLAGGPLHPAALVRLSWLQQGQERPLRPTLYLWPTTNASVQYEVIRSSGERRRGEIQPGATCPLGWADWSLTLVRLYPHAVVEESVERAPAPTRLGQTFEAIHARVFAKTGPATWEGWLLPGQPVQVASSPGHNYTIQWQFRHRELPFRVRLLDFEVPREEGGEIPSDFVSTLQFEDPQGHQVVGKAKMNHPATFPGGWWRSVLGRNYKFSQSGWNPQDLNESVLQVLFDPGWPLKWLGSLGICLGIALMFYWKPRGRREGHNTADPKGNQLPVGVAKASNCGGKT